MRVTAVVPSLNPDDGFLRVVDGLVEAGFTRILLVDDGSDPEHRIRFDRAARHPECTVLHHDGNKGKGRALKTAMEYFLAHRNGDVGIVTLDGDGQHAIPDVVRCAEALEEHPEELILGVRDFSGENVPARSRKGNRITSFVFTKLCKMPISDTQTGLRGIPAAFAEHLLGVSGERFEFETNMLLETRHTDTAIREVPIETVYLDDNRASHFRAFRDSVRIYWLICRFLFTDLVKYVSSSLLATVIEYVVFVALCRIFDGMVQLTEALYLLIAEVGARAVSSVINFLINRRVVFHSDEGLGKTALRYYTVSLGQMALAYGGIYAAVRFLYIPDWIAKPIVDTLLFFFSYRLQRTWVFGKKEKKGNE